MFEFIFNLPNRIVLHHNILYEASVMMNEVGQLPQPR